MIKRFLQWIHIKEKLHNTIYYPPFVSEGEIWWASIGDNIGQEINGKGDNFSRPVYIYHKFSHNFYLVIPMTSKIKEGSWFLGIHHEGKNVFLCMNQLRTLDIRRFRARLAEVDDLDKLRIYYTFLTIYGSKIKNST